MILFFLSIVFVNLFLYYQNYFFLFFVGFLMLCIGKKYNFKLVIVSAVCVILFFTCNINFYNYRIDKVDGVLEIVEVHENYSIIEDNSHQFLIYNNDNSFVRGNKILIEGEVVDLRNSYNEFNNYLNKKGINYRIDYYDYEVVDNSIYLNDVIIDRLLESKDEENVSYLKLILFNEKDDYNESLYESFSVFSLTYLIAVSGFHINILLRFFKKVFKNSLVSYIGVIFYLFLLDFSVSSYRAFLCNIFKKLNNKLGFDLSNIDIISLIGIVFVFIDAGIMFSNSFIFSFLATFVLEIFRLYSRRSTVLSFYIYLINIPLILFNYYELNVYTLLLSIVLSYPISFLYVFSFIYLFFDKFYLIYRIVIEVFYNVFNFFGSFDYVLIFGKPSYTFLIIYYFILLCFFLCKEKRSKFKYLYISLLFCCLSYQYFKPCINGNEQFYFLNVGQGDCMVFTIPNSKEVVLLDTGGSKHKDVAKREIIPFLKSKGVNKIRKIVISHDDFDHNGALESLKSNFGVGEVVDYYVSSVEIGNKTFINLNVNKGRNNDGSLVLYGKYGDYDLLLMGDASTKIEKEIVKKINNVDILKVGHHGSNTSSCEEFLAGIEGKIAVISVGENNSYGHPSDEVIERLEKFNYIVLRTDENNDIGFLKNIFGISFVDYFS